MSDNQDNVTLADDPDQPTMVLRPDEAGASVAARPPQRTCVECHSALDSDQIYCLECGAPTSEAPRLRSRLSPAGVVALGLVALGGGAGALAVAIANDSSRTVAIASTAPTSLTVPTGGAQPGVDDTTGRIDPSLTSTVDPTLTSVDPSLTSTVDPTLTSVDPSLTSTVDPTLTSVDPSLTSTVDPTLTSVDPSLTSTVPDTSGTPSETPSAAASADSWPDGTNGWTVILASTSDAAAAARFREQVAASGRSAGLIESSLYSTLTPDLWVVYTGVLTSRDAAINSAATLRRTYPGAYAAEITGG